MDGVSTVMAMIKGDAPGTERDHRGTVRSVSGGVVRVLLDGGAEPTDCASSVVACRIGDRVIVTIDPERRSATVKGNLTAPSTDDEYAVNAEGRLVRQLDEVRVDTGRFEQVFSSAADVTVLVAEDATVAELEAADAEIARLEAGGATVQRLVATRASMGLLTADEVDAVMVNAAVMTVRREAVDDLSARIASVGDLRATKADITLANIAEARISLAAVENLLATSGMFTELRVVDEKVTGKLDGVEVNGDLITAGTIAADRIIVRQQVPVYDEDGNQVGWDVPDGKSLWYQLNLDQAGQQAGVDEDGNPVYYPTLSQIQADDAFKSQLHGSHIVAESITANKIDVADLVASKVFSDLVKANFVEARQVQVGSADNTNIFIDGDSLQFNTANGDAVASILVDRISGLSKFHIDIAHVDDSLEWSRWSLVENSAGNLNLRWTGNYVDDEELEL